MVETESLANGKILVSVFEGDRRRGGELSITGSHVEHAVELVAQGLVVGPERERVTILRGGSGIDEVERAVLGVVIELFQDPRLDLSAAVGEGDAIKIVLDDSFGFARGLLCDSGGDRHDRGNRCGGGSRLRRLRLRGLLLWRRGSRKIFLEQRLEGQHEDERHRKYEQQAAFAAGFMLRILIFGQVK